MGGWGVAVNETHFKCLIFISVHATLDHAICVTLVLGGWRTGRERRGSGWREAAGRQSRGGKGVVGSERAAEKKHNEKSKSKGEGASARSYSTVSKVFDAC